MLSWIKKYKEIFYMIGIVLSSIIATFLGDGLFWKSQENDRNKTKLVLDKYETATNLRMQIENLYQQLFELNEDYIKKIDNSVLNKNDSVMFRQKFEYILDSFDPYEANLANLENRMTREMSRPYPIREFYFVRKAKILRIEHKPTPYYLFENSTFSILIFIILLLIYSAIIVWLTFHFTKKRVNKG